MLQAEHFLPDFVIAWMLLQRSGLHQHKKGALIANLKNEFTTDKVKAVLRLNWPEDELRRRDASRGTALYVFEGEDDEDVMIAENDEYLHAILLADAEAEDYHILEAHVQKALQSIHTQKNTLRQAREKQHHIRQNRRFLQALRWHLVMEVLRWPPNAFDVAASIGLATSQQGGIREPGVSHRRGSLQCGPTTMKAAAARWSPPSQAERLSLMVERLPVSAQSRPWRSGLA